MFKKLISKKTDLTQLDEKLINLKKEYKINPDGFSDDLLIQVKTINGFKLLDPCAVYKLIGEGGGGRVYLGHHLNLNIKVAVKCPFPVTTKSDKLYIERFKQEAQSAAKINHPNVVRVYDVRSVNNIHYIIMEYIQGETLREYIQKNNPLKIEKFINIACEAIHGLAEAHKASMVHRDIKPDNILLAQTGEVKLADLGLAKPIMNVTARTTSNSIVGTPQYMAPEQFKDHKSLGPEIDVWAFGVTMYFMLTGEEAIKGYTLYEVIKNIVDNPFPNILEKRTDLPDSLIRIINKCTKKNPFERYSSAIKLESALNNLSKNIKNISRNISPVLKEEIRSKKYSKTKDEFSRKKPIAEIKPAEFEKRIAVTKKVEEEVKKFFITDIHEAALNGDIESIKHIFKQKGFVYSTNKKNSSGQSPLIMATLNGHDEIATYLLSDAVPNLAINLQDNNGWTALMYAAMLGHVNIAKTLINKDANTTIKNSSGKTALDIAIQFDHIPIIIPLRTLADS